MVAINKDSMELAPRSGRFSKSRFCLMAAATLALLSMASFCIQSVSVDQLRRRTDTLLEETKTKALGFVDSVVQHPTVDAPNSTDSRNVLLHSEVPYPRWGNETERISRETVLNAVSATLHYRNDDADNPMRGEQLVYAVLNGQLYRAPTPENVIRPKAIHPRIELMEDHAVQLLMAFERGDFSQSARFPHLQAALEEQGDGFVFILDYGDSKYCLDEPRNLLHTADPKEINSANLAKSTFPIFTMSSPTDCQYAFPMPTYQSIRLASEGTFPETKRWFWQRAKLWRQKYDQAVWRGSPTGPAKPTVENNTRVRLCEIASQHPDLLDAKLTGDVWYEEAAYLHGDRIEMKDMQQYKAIVDVDGNSWSSRFGQLLCMSSVVLKVEPKNVDYFYPELRPYEHFIPVMADLSDLVQQTEFALARRNQRLVRNIVRNANNRCREKFSGSQLQFDTLTVWDEYLRRMDSTSFSAEKLVKEYNFERSRRSV